MRPAAPDPRAPRSIAAVTACLAALLEQPAESVPAPADGTHWLLWQEQLAGLGLALVRLPAGRLRWPGYWIGLVEGAGGDLDAVVMWDAACVFDPRERDRARPEPLEALLLAVLDPVTPAAPRGRTTGIVEAISIAPATAGPTVSVESVQAIAGVGLEGDRYAMGEGTFARRDRTGQALTLIEAEALEKAGVVSAGESRRNVITRGIDLNALVGQEFTVGGVRCLGRRLCEPCSHLERLTRPGILRPLVHRAGLRADILVGGTISLGDEVGAG